MKMRPKVHTTKHYVSHTQTTTANGALDTFKFAEAVAVASKDAALEVEEGSTISAIYVEWWIGANQATYGTCTMCLEKVPAGQTSVTAAQLANLGAYPNKKNIFVTHQGLTPGTGTAPTPFFAGWIHIPKGKQRMGLGDVLVATSTPVSGGTISCGICTYKEQQ